MRNWICRLCSVVSLTLHPVTLVLQIKVWSEDLRITAEQNVAESKKLLLVLVEQGAANRSAIMFSAPGETKKQC